MDINDALNYFKENIDWIFNGIGAVALGWIIKDKLKYKISNKLNDNATSIVVDGDYKNNNDSHQSYIIHGNYTPGISIKEAREIALDVYKANSYELSENAQREAIRRAEEIAEDFFTDIYNNFPEKMQRLEEPSIQSSFFEAQKEYAKSGEETLKNQLLQLLSDRINTEEYTLKQIVLDEAIKTISKLTKDQINCLSLIASLIYLIHNITNLTALADLINNRILIFYSENMGVREFFSHMQYSGSCIILPEGKTFISIEEIFLKRYTGLFSNGFTEEEFKKDIDQNIDYYRPLLMECLHNKQKLQINAMNINVLENEMNKNGINKNTNKIIELFKRTTMNKDEVATVLIEINSNMEKLIEFWKSKADLKVLKLTSVGLTIATLNYNQRTKGSVQLDSYI